MSRLPFALSTTLDNVFDITPSDVSNDSSRTGITAARSLVTGNLLSELLLPRIERLLNAGGSKAPTLAAALVQAKQKSAYSDITNDLGRIHHLVSQMDDGRWGGAGADSVTATDLGSLDGPCARIRQEDRHLYGYCKESRQGQALMEAERLRKDGGPDERTVYSDVMRLIQSMQGGPEGRKLADSLIRRGVSRFEIRSRATELIEDSKRVFKTNRLFEPGSESDDTGAVHGAVVQLIQNVDFIQHIMELMAMHLPPDYPWRSEQVVHVATWWIMHYISMLRPQLVHAVIDCPDNDVNKCKLIGLSLGANAVPVAKWHGSTARIQASGSNAIVSDRMFHGMKWFSSYTRFRKHVDELSISMSPQNGRGGGMYHKLSDDQKYNLARIASSADTGWRSSVLGPGARAQVVVVPPFPSMLKQWASNPGTHPNLDALLGTSPRNHDVDLWLKHTMREYNGDGSENAVNNGNLRDVIKELYTQMGGVPISQKNKEQTPHFKNQHGNVFERYADFYVHVGALLETPARLFEVLEDVFTSDEISDSKFLDNLYIGGMYRYGIDFRNYGSLVDSNNYSREYGNSDIRKYIPDPKRIASIAAFQNNCRNVISQIDSSMSYNVYLRPNIEDENGKPKVCRPNGILHRDAYRPTSKYRNSAVFMALLFMCQAHLTAITTYASTMERWYQTLYDYGIDLSTGTATTYREAKPFFDSYYSDVADDSKQGDTRWNHLGKSDSDISLNTNEWLDQITRG
jgi:hypothetical protein